MLEKVEVQPGVLWEKTPVKLLESLDYSTKRYISKAPKQILFKALVFNEIAVCP